MSLDSNVKASNVKVSSGLVLPSIAPEKNGLSCKVSLYNIFHYSLITLIFSLSWRNYNSSQGYFQRIYEGERGWGGKTVIGKDFESLGMLILSLWHTFFGIYLK